MTRFPESPDVIASRNHIEIKRIRKLHLREERGSSGLFYVEGMRFVAMAVRHNAHIERLVVCPPLMAHPFARELARRQDEAGTPILRVTPEVMHSIALVDDPQGIGAVVRQRWQPLDKAKLGGRLCWLALDAVQSPGNLGTILRTSEAVGGAGIMLLGDAADPYDPATVRSSMGATFTQRYVRTTPEKLRRWKEERAWLLVGTSPSSPTEYNRVSYDAPTILLMGGERKGLPQELQAMCDIVVRIPMVGHADSLNLAVATGVVLYELFRQRRRVAGDI